MGLLGGLSSILGFSPNTAGSAYRGAANAALGQVANSANTYGQLANSAASAYGDDNGQYRAALGNEEDALGQGFTNADRSGYIAGQTGNVGTQYQQGQAGLTSNLSARGLGMAGSMAGGLADLATARAGAYSQASNAAQNYFSNAQLSRDAQLTGLTSGAASQDYGRQTGALGAEDSTNMGLANAYGNEANQAYAEQQAQNNSLFSNLGGIAGIFGGIYGRSSANSALYGGGSGSQPQAGGAGSLLSSLYGM